MGPEAVASMPGGPGETPAGWGERSPGLPTDRPGGQPILAQEVDPVAVVDGGEMSVAEAFYVDVIWELGEHAHRGGTAYGAAAVVKRLAKERGLDVSGIGLPRPSRAEMEDAAFLRQQGRRA